MDLAAANKIFVTTSGVDIANLKPFFDAGPQHFYHWSVILLFHDFFHFLLFVYKFNLGSIYTFYQPHAGRTLNLPFGIKMTLQKYEK